MHLLHLPSDDHGFKRILHPNSRKQYFSYCSDFTFYTLKASRKLKNNSKFKSINARNQDLEFIFSQNQHLLLFLRFRNQDLELKIEIRKRRRKLVRLAVVVVIA
ncbi:hypothetical protein LXL04_025346 [Taraxacum kok-saghyz]